MVLLFGNVMLFIRVAFLPVPCRTSGLCKSSRVVLLNFFTLSVIMDLRHQSSAMCIIMLGEETHTRGLQRT